DCARASSTNQVGNPADKPIAAVDFKKDRRGSKIDFTVMTVSRFVFIFSDGSAIRAIDQPYFSSNKLTLSCFGNFSGIGSVTRPVPAHSVPRTRVVTKPAQRMPVRSWPMGVWKTRPLP